MTIDDCRIIDLKKIQDPRGNLTPIEGGVDVPFEIKRIFYLYDVPGGESRGAHAHYKDSQFLIAASGAFEVMVDDGVNKKAFVASYYNSLSFAFAEILGRNFGGGCLELMPSEVGEIYLPYREENEKIFDTLDHMLRRKASADEILDYTDEIILRQGMGLSEEEVKLARSIWHKIINRRLSRETLDKPIEKRETEKEKHRK